MTNALIEATLGTTWSLCGLGVLLVAVRALLINKGQSRFSFEYGWIIVSTILSFAFQVLIVMAVKLGAGLHVTEIKVENIIPAINLFFVMCCLGVATVCTAKLAVVSLLWPMETPTKSSIWKASLIASSVCLIGLAIAQIVLVELSREKIKTITDLLEHDSIEVLNDSFNFAYGFGAFSALVDLYLACYPAVLVLTHCDTKTTQALAMTPIMLGVIPIVAAVTRTIALHNITAGDDVTYNAALVLLAFSAEYGSTAVLCSLFPIGQAVRDMIRGYSTDGSAPQPTAEGDVEVVNAQLLERQPEMRQERHTDPGFDKTIWTTEEHDAESVFDKSA